jgi:hypothetical protein
VLLGLRLIIQIVIDIFTQNVFIKTVKFCLNGFINHIEYLIYNKIGAEG